MDFYTGKIKEHFGNKQILPYLFLFNPQHKPPNSPKLPLSPVKPAAKPHAPHAQKPHPSQSRKNYIGHNFTHKGHNFSYKASNFSNNGYHNKNTDFRSYFLTFEGGARLELMNRPRMEDPEKTLNRTGFAHIAFSLGSREGVDTLTARLKADGYSVISGPRTTGDGYYESCILDREGNQIEITV